MVSEAVDWICVCEGEALGLLLRLQAQGRLIDVSQTKEIRKEYSKSEKTSTFDSLSKPTVLSHATSTASVHPLRAVVLKQPLESTSSGASPVCIGDTIAACSTIPHGKKDKDLSLVKLPIFRWFPSYRMLTATMLCLCFASVHMMNSNMGMAMVCMVEDTKSTPKRHSSVYSNSSNTHQHHHQSEGTPKVQWSSEDQVATLWTFFTQKIEPLSCVLLALGVLATK
uniref:Uncharacterized protein n=1 Tax=Ditylenchus dipsaci TaxID=166011 RepID=A0A915DKC6_9BILA